MKTLESICLLVVTACLSALMVEGALFFRDARRDLADVSGKATASFDRLNTVLDNAATVEAKLSGAADQQAEYWQKTQSQIYKLTVDAKGLIARTDRSLNADIVPELIRNLGASNTLIASTTRDVDDLGMGVRTVVDSMATQLSDPRIGQSLDSVTAILENSQAATADIAVTASDLRKTSDYYYKQLMRPAKKIEVIGHTVIRGVGWFFGW